MFDNEQSTRILAAIGNNVDNVIALDTLFDQYLNMNKNNKIKLLNAINRSEFTDCPYLKDWITFLEKR